MGAPGRRDFGAPPNRGEGLGETRRAHSDDYAQRLYYQDSDFDVVERVIAVADRLRALPAAGRHRV